jgi:hypothetical protein
MARWFRVYDDLVDDPKVQCLEPELFRALVNLWCIASRNKGRLPPIAQVAFSLRMKPQQAAAVITQLVALGLIDEDAQGFEPHNWPSRQYKSDVSNERVAAFRERQRNAKCNVTETVKETPPETEDTDTESERKKEGAREARGSRYSSEFDEQFWKPYPRTPVMSKAEAWKAWQKASGDDRALIVAAVPRYAAWLKSKPDHPAVHACRFVTQRRFEGFGEPTAPAIEIPAGKFYAPPESRELAAWDAHYRATRGRGLPRDSRGGWLVDAQWPPGCAQEVAA